MTDHETGSPQDDISLADLLDHEYDGIREYDNPCPSWWSWLFFLTAVFAPIYFFYFHIGRAGMSVETAHQQAVNNNLKLRFSEIGELTADEATLIQYMQKPDWLLVGESVYQQRCKSCHGDGGCGLVGPNLTDDFYKNVEQLADVAKVVADGAANGSMPSWRTRLHPNEIVLVSAYVAALRGKNPPNPKASEGKQIAPWPAAPADAAEEPATTEAPPDQESAGTAETEPAK